MAEFEQVGETKLTYYFFDVYKISYWKDAENAKEKLELTYLRDVDKKHSLKGWEKGLESYLENNDYNDAINWIMSHTVDMKKGDVFKIIKKDNTVEFVVNDEVKAKSKDQKVYQLVFEPWIGENPVDQSLKKDLCPKECS